MKPNLLVFGIALLLAIIQPAHSSAAEWRSATEAELKEVIPARAPVEKERIETEFRTASGITDGKGHFVAGVVLITAGYSAEGKYSHFFLAQVPLKLGNFTLSPGEYVLGWRKNADSLTVSFYNAKTGEHLGDVEAVRLSRSGKIQSFAVEPPAEKALISIGRFGFPYEIRSR